MCDVKLYGLLFEIKLLLSTPYDLVIKSFIEHHTWIIHRINNIFYLSLFMCDAYISQRGNGDSANVFNIYIHLDYIRIRIQPHCDDVRDTEILVLTVPKLHNSASTHYYNIVSWTIFQYGIRIQIDADRNKYLTTDITEH